MNALPNAIVRTVSTTPRVADAVCFEERNVVFPIVSDNVRVKITRRLEKLGLYCNLPIQTENILYDGIKNINDFSILPSIEFITTKENFCFGFQFLTQQDTTNKYLHTIEKEDLHLNYINSDVIAFVVLRCTPAPSFAADDGCTDSSKQ